MSRRAAFTRTLAGHRGAAVLVACAMLAACADSAGDGALPVEFGPPAHRLFGCADVGGVYRWPPQADGMPRARARARKAEPWPGAYPANDLGPAQLWIDVRHEGIVFHTRAVPRGAARASAWSQVEFDGRDYRCARGRIEFAPREVDVSYDWPGATGTQVLVLQRLKDGAVAFATVRRISGLEAPLFQWGEQSLGHIPRPDRVTWRWSKLERISDAPGSAMR